MTERDPYADADAAFLIFVAAMWGLLIVGLVVGIFVRPLVHKGEHCVQKMLTHHAKLSDSWDCTKWAKND